MSKLRSSLGLGLMLAVVSGPASARATVVLSKSIEEMAGEASAVVRAVVRQRQSAWDEAHKRIYTYTELELRDAWIGAPVSPLIVRTLGGEVGTVGMNVSGTPTFEPGEEVVLFLRADPLDAERFQVIGMSQGKYRVEERAEGAFAVPAAEGLVYASRDGAGGVTVADPSPNEAPRAIPLAQLAKRVRAAKAGEAEKTLAPVPGPRAPGAKGSGEPTPPPAPRAPQVPEAGER